MKRQTRKMRKGNGHNEIELPDGTVLSRFFYHPYTNVPVPKTVAEWQAQRQKQDGFTDGPIEDKGRNERSATEQSIEFVGDVASVIESMSVSKDMSIGVDGVVVAVNEENGLSNSDASLKCSLNNIGHIGTRMDTYEIVSRECIDDGAKEVKGCNERSATEQSIEFVGDVASVIESMSVSKDMSIGFDAFDDYVTDEMMAEFKLDEVSPATYKFSDENVSFTFLEEFEFKS